ncbi:hypothetical protein C900_04346 [Fulvivirga imtechensis AK7]|uniref:Uncharacterized protein n=1 Tax=Fulvivirga imtechensis AK7 TaxID=1237149 RepID=L8K0P0_9BACT|nr:hypothetical protein C900_04346 [Fulvivirga imtechensis AK7]
MLRAECGGSGLKHVWFVKKLKQTSGGALFNFQSLVKLNSEAYNKD